MHTQRTRGSLRKRIQKKAQKDNIENNEHLKPGLHLTLRDGMRVSAQAQTIKPGRLQLKELEILECFSAVDALRGFFFFFVRAAQGSRGNAAPSFKQLCNKRKADFGFPVLRCAPSMRLLKVAVGAVETANKPGQRLLPVRTSVF